MAYTIPINSDVYANSSGAISGNSSSTPYSLTRNINDYTWKISWTGFKTHQANLNLVGQWVAVKPGHNIYSSVPGNIGLFLPGDQFDLSASYEEGQVPLYQGLMSYSDFHDLCEDQKMMGLARLLKYLRVNYR